MSCTCRPARTRALARACLAAALLCGGEAALAEPAEAAHAAACVAALKAQESALAGAARAGTAVEPELMNVLRSGIAIIGTQYKAGLGEAEARQLLAAAEPEFDRLAPADARQRRASACARANRCTRKPRRSSEA